MSWHLASNTLVVWHLFSVTWLLVFPDSWGSESFTGQFLPVSASQSWALSWQLTLTVVCFLVLKIPVITQNIQEKIPMMQKEFSLVGLLCLPKDYRHLSNCWLRLVIWLSGAWVWELHISTANNWHLTSSRQQYWVSLAHLASWHPSDILTLAATDFTTGHLTSGNSQWTTIANKDSRFGQTKKCLSTFWVRLIWTKSRIANTKHL